MTEPRTRPAAMAGSLYPAEPAQLQALVEQQLSRKTPESGSWRILIVPHAGLRYSGAVAGAGFSRLGHCERVILLGVSHYARFDGVAACGYSRWQTPLGNVPVDLDTIRRLTDTYPAFVIHPEIHREEHCLEVQIPFLQRRLKTFQIVPLLLGDDHPARLLQVSAILATELDEETILVATSDLSHFPDRSNAGRVDRQTIASILTLDAGAFRDSMADAMRLNVPGLRTCACGAAAIETAIRVSNALYLQRARLLAYQNSADNGGDERRVVGYASIGIDRERS